MSERADTPRSDPDSDSVKAHVRSTDSPVEAEADTADAVAPEPSDEADAAPPENSTRVRESTGIAPAQVVSSRDGGATADLYAAEDDGSDGDVDPLLSCEDVVSMKDAVGLLVACADEMELYVASVQRGNPSNALAANAAVAPAAAAQNNVSEPADEEQVVPTAEPTVEPAQQTASTAGEPAATAAHSEEERTPRVSNQASEGGEAKADTAIEASAEESPAEEPSSIQALAESSEDVAPAPAPRGDGVGASESAGEAEAEAEAAAPGATEPAAQVPSTVEDELRRRVATLEAENKELRERLHAAEPAKPKKATFASPDRANRTALLLTSPARLRTSPDMRAKDRGPQLSPGTVNALISSVSSPERREARSRSPQTNADDEHHHHHRTPAPATSASAAQSRAASRETRVHPSGIPASEAGTSSVADDAAALPRTGSKKGRKAAAAAAEQSRERLGNYNPNARPATLFSKRVLAQSSASASLHNTPPSLRHPAMRGASSDVAPRSGQGSRNVSASPPRKPAAAAPQPRVRPNEAQRKRSLVRTALAPFHGSANSPSPSH